MMCLNIVGDMMYWSLEWGFLESNYSVGGYVASARDPSVSMIRLTHNIWIGFKIYCFISAAPISVIETATTLTVSWNWMNFRMQS
jgi:hypothetical protein